MVFRMKSNYPAQKTAGSIFHPAGHNTKIIRNDAKDKRAANIGQAALPAHGADHDTVSQLEKCPTGRD